MTTACSCAGSIAIVGIDLADTNTMRSSGSRTWPGGGSKHAVPVFAVTKPTKMPSSKTECKSCTRFPTRYWALPEKFFTCWDRRATPSKPSKPFKAYARPGCDRQPNIKPFKNSDKSTGRKMSKPSAVVPRSMTSMAFEGLPICATTRMSSSWLALQQFPRSTRKASSVRSVAPFCTPPSSASNSWTSRTVIWSKIARARCAPTRCKSWGVVGSPIRHTTS
mmetsp:Transcript_164804/g.523921  ORF Transcript_164804/g.523921 Transcript_164804/m.523921 type:complete len:221 (+) Transcript_164804:976-1638(+)